MYTITNDAVFKVHFKKTIFVVYMLVMLSSRKAIKIVKQTGAGGCLLSKY